MRDERARPLAAFIGLAAVSAGMVIAGLRAPTAPTPTAGAPSPAPPAASASPDGALPPAAAAPEIAPVPKVTDVAQVVARAVARQNSTTRIAQASRPSAPRPSTSRPSTTTQQNLSARQSVAAPRNHGAVVSASHHGAGQGPHRH